MNSSVRLAAEATALAHPRLVRRRGIEDVQPADGGHLRERQVLEAARPVDRQVHSHRRCSPAGSAPCRSTAGWSTATSSRVAHVGGVEARRAPLRGSGSTSSSSGWLTRWLLRPPPNGFELATTSTSVGSIGQPAGALQRRKSARRRKQEDAIGDAVDLPHLAVRLRGLRLDLLGPEGVQPSASSAVRHLGDIDPGEDVEREREPARPGRPLLLVERGPDRRGRCPWAGLSPSPKHAAERDSGRVLHLHPGQAGQWVAAEESGRTGRSGSGCCWRSIALRGGVGRPAPPSRSGSPPGSPCCRCARAARRYGERPGALAGEKDHLERGLLRGLRPAAAAEGDLRGGALASC